jgi:hypothetical protein
VENSAHALLSTWESFYVIVGSSAAALTGLQFVVIALVSDLPVIGSAESVGAFGTPTVFHFCLCLLVAALLSAPWPLLAPLVWLLLGTGIVGVLYTVIVIRRARRQTAYQPVGEDWVWHVILPMIAYTLLIVASLFVAVAPTKALFLVGGIAILLIFIGIHNAWDAVAYLAVQLRRDRQDETPGHSPAANRS